MSDRVQLADSVLGVEPEVDHETGPDNVVIGWGCTYRDGLGIRAERGGVEIAILGGLVLDPVLGVLRTSIGIAGGRIVTIGRAGNPDTMDGVDVVLDTATAVFDASGMLVTPGVVDSHVHWLSPQVSDAALAGGTTTLVVQDFGPVWNLGVNPPEALAVAFAAFEAVPANVAFLVRASSSRPEPVEHALVQGGGGLKIHEDVSAGPEQLRCAVEIADRHDVQLAIHTDGLNELLSADHTAQALGDRTVHLYHIEGVGGGHPPDLLSLAGRERFLTSSTTPTVPYGPGSEPEHLAMVGPSHLLRPRERRDDAAILRERVRGWTMAAESVLHDLGVIHMLASDSQGMGRAGEVLRRAMQCADAMGRQRGRDGGPADNERVLRYLAKVTINPARTHGLAAHVGSLEPGKLADAVFWHPGLFGVRPELVLKAGMPVWGASGDPNATSMTSEPVRVDRQVAALGRAPARVSLGFVAAAALDAELPTERELAVVENCRELTAADMVRNARRGNVVVDRASRSVRLDGELIECEPTTQLAMSSGYLLG